MASLSRKWGAGAVIAASLTPLVFTSAFAGTGGSDYNGILYGEYGKYCDGALQSVKKTDKINGQALANATFSVVAANQASDGVKVYTKAQVAAGVPTADTKKWVVAFNTAADNAMKATPFGATLKAAQVSLGATRSTTNATDPAIANQSGQTATERVLYPADITAITDPTAQSAAMTNWVNMAAVAGNSSTVADFYKQAADRLNAIGPVLYGPTFSLASPQAAGTAATTAVAGTQSAVTYQAEYSKALAEVNFVKAAIAASGYTSATYSGNVVTFGAVALGAQNWTNFTSAYNSLKTPANWSFGLGAPTYDLVAKVIGTDAVVAANKAADTAIGATQGSAVELTTDGSGMAYYETFGRSTATATTCNHLTATVTEIAAPTGYEIDNAAGVGSSPTDLDISGTTSVAGAPLGFSDTLKTLTVASATTPPPQFEAGR